MQLSLRGTTAHPTEEETAKLGLQYYLLSSTITQLLTWSSIKRTERRHPNAAIAMCITVAFLGNAHGGKELSSRRLEIQWQVAGFKS